MPVSSDLEHAGTHNQGPSDLSPISISDNTACEEEEASDIQHPLLLAGASYEPFDSPSSLRGAAAAAPETSIQTVHDDDIAAPTTAVIPDPIIQLPDADTTSPPFPHEEDPGPGQSPTAELISRITQRDKKKAIIRKARRGHGRRRAAVLASSARREKKQLWKAARCTSSNCKSAIGQGTPREATCDKQGDLSMGPPERRYHRVTVSLGLDEQTWGIAARSGEHGDDDDDERTTTAMLLRDGTMELETSLHESRGSLQLDDID